MRHLLRRSRITGVMVMIASLAGAARARAEPTADDEALATLLFQEGRALMAGGRLPEACQKLEESQRLDPGGGTILNLALCHEREGRLARSWSEFKEAVIVAKRDGRKDREIEAANHVSALEPRLSRLTIVVPAGTQVEGLVIERDGRELGRGAWSTAIPIDGGPHVVRATARGREPFTTTVVVGAESDACTVEIPVLATPVVVVAPPRVALPSSSAVATSPVITPARLRLLGIGSTALGVVLLGTAGYVLSTALSAKRASNSDCFVDGCGTLGLQNRDLAVTRGDRATFLGAGGAALAGAGVTLIYLARRSTATTEKMKLATRITFIATPGTIVTGIGGAF